jgi:anti-anti-sigma factor
VSLDNEGQHFSPKETSNASVSGQLEMTVGSQENTTLWKLAGEVDMASVPRLYEEYEALPSDPGGVLMVDLSGITFLDSSGLAFLTYAYKGLKARGGQLVVLEPTPEIRRLFDITGLNSIFRIEPPDGEDDQSA